MAEPLAQYSPDLVTFSFLGVPIRGYQDNTFIDVERDEDAFTYHVGSLGDVARSRNLNRMGKITLTLTQYASSNGVLSAFQAQDEQFGNAVGAIQIKDSSGSNTFAHCHSAWISRIPKLTRAKEPKESTVWVFHCADIQIAHGGNIILPGSTF